jgi:pimeloyl-ACP methyl ester carboxylesterase
MPIVRAGDADIHYEVAGEGDPILWIMGLAADSRMWLFQLPAFPQHRNITFDNRGVGMSSSPPGPYTMEEMATDTLAVLDAAGVEQAHVVSISMGGAIAQHLALKSPERVRSLTLTATWCRRNPYLERMSELGRLVADSIGHEALIKASMLWLFTPHLFLENPALIQMIESTAVQFQPPVETFDHQVAGLLEHDVRDQLSQLRVPALVMAGRRDILVPPELSEEIAAAIPGATLRIIDGGHAFNVENAAQYNAEVAAFIAEH